MGDYLVATIDGAKARFFTLETAFIPEYESSPNLQERVSLFNSARELEGKELWANTKTGRNRGGAAINHSYDDRRQAHIVKFERDFVKKISQITVDLINKYQASSLILIVELQILGLIRETLLPLLPKNFTVNELAKDLCSLKPMRLHQYLANKNLLPQCKKVLI